MRIFLLALALISCASSLIAGEPYVGHWRSGMKAGIETGGSLRNVTDLYLNANGTFRWYMRFTLAEGKTNETDKGGRYQIEEDRLLLFYDSSPERAQAWRFQVEGDTFWLMDKTVTEKIPYLKVSETSADNYPNTPAKVAVAYYKACGEPTIDHDKLNALRSAASLAEEMTLPPDVRKIRRGAAERVGGNGTQTKVVLLKERVDGDKAYVDVEIHYAAYPSAKFNAELIRENGKWKLK